jgi:hypothetical protein
VKRDVPAEHRCHGGKARTFQKPSPIGIRGATEQDAVGLFRVLDIEIEQIDFSPAHGLAFLWSGTCRA